MRASGAMEILMTRVDTNTSRLVVRYRRNYILHYLHNLVQGFTSRLAAHMVKHGYCEIIPPSQVGLVTRFLNSGPLTNLYWGQGWGPGTGLVSIWKLKQALSHHNMPIAVSLSNNYLRNRAGVVALATIAC